MATCLQNVVVIVVDDVVDVDVDGGGVDCC